MRIALINVLNQQKKAVNKDVNGGLGTCDDYGNSWSSKVIRLIKRKNVQVPIISFAFLQAIFKNKGHTVHYFEGSLPGEREFYDLILIYGTIVDYKNENNVCSILKKRFPYAKVGFFGPFPSQNPASFTTSDFIVRGEAEAYFLKQFKDLEQLRGEILVTASLSFEELFTPDYDGFPIKKYSYWPALSRKPFLVLQSSKGCPYSCRIYCSYGAYQGAIVRQRSATKVVQDILELQRKYKIKSLQFRDPIFGMHKEFVREFCGELQRAGVKIDWGIETRADLLMRENIKMMYDVGLRSINIGIETSNQKVAQTNKRHLVEKQHQEQIIEYCRQLGIFIAAFYILAWEEDTEETIEGTIAYARTLCTPLARFSVLTPYPGTSFYEQLEREGKILTQDYERYNQFTLVFKHPNLTPERVRKLLESAYQRYYFSSYLLKFLQWKMICWQRKIFTSMKPNFTH